MAVFNTARLRDVLVRGNIAQDPAATELVEELNSQTEDALSGYGTLDRMDLMEARLLQAMAEMDARAAERDARAAERDTQQARHINQAVGIVLAGIALAVGNHSWIRVAGLTTMPRLPSSHPSYGANLIRRMVLARNLRGR